MSFETFAVESSRGDYEEFGTYKEAVEYASRLADEDDRNGSCQGDRSWASRDNFYCVHYDNGHYIQVVRAEEG